MSTPDALIERLRTDVLWHKRRGNETIARDCEEAAAEIERLRADAARYQFLRADFSPMGLNIDGNHAWAYRRNATLKGPNLDSAIDAAMRDAPADR